jgi:hypothetical protein
MLRTYNGTGYSLFKKEQPLKEIGKDKGKAIPLQAWTGPEGSRRLMLPDFKTFGI